jgi:hypothetical protein
MTGTNCDFFTHKSSRSYLNHLVIKICMMFNGVFSNHYQYISRILEHTMFLQLYPGNTAVNNRKVVSDNLEGIIMVLK